MIFTPNNIRLQVVIIDWNKFIFIGFSFWGLRALWPSGFGFCGVDLYHLWWTKSDAHRRTKKSLPFFKDRLVIWVGGDLLSHFRSTIGA
jgi:hypothetical protein